MPCLPSRHCSFPRGLSFVSKKVLQRRYFCHRFGLSFIISPSEITSLPFSDSPLPSSASPPPLYIPSSPSPSPTPTCISRRVAVKSDPFLIFLVRRIFFLTFNLDNKTAIFFPQFPLRDKSSFLSFFFCSALKRLSHDVFCNRNTFIFPRVGKNFSFETGE